MSRRIVEFARAHGATLLVFEHLTPYRPKKGSFSQRGNEKRAYRLRSKIYHYSRFKAWEGGIVTCQVSPRDTGRECAVCKAHALWRCALWLYSWRAAGVLYRVWYAQQRRSQCKS